MNVTLTLSAVEYLKKKRVSEITIDIKDNMCWLGAGIPEVYLGKQLDAGQEVLYNVVDVSGINVYYFNQFDTKNGEIIVQLSKFLFMKSLEVKGVDMY